MEEEFTLTRFDFIELNKLMKIMNWVGSGGEANILITEREVRVNQRIETQKRKKIRRGDVVQLGDHSVTIK